MAPRHDVPVMTIDRDPVTGERIRRGAVGVLWRQWPLLLVLGASAGGLLTVALGAFRPGCILLGSGAIFAALARAVLPARRVGLLVVRSRVFDVLMLLVLGAGIIFFALIVPRGRG